MERYIHQITFIGEAEQKKLGSAHIMVVGLGAIGSVAAELLVRAGIGSVTLIDHDIVELSNLQRQSLYDELDMGKPKALAAEIKLKIINSDANIKAYAAHLDEINMKLLDADVVLDCTDNLETRFLINEYCLKHKIKWVHSAAAGAIGVVLPITSNYCFACVYGHALKAMTCDDAGILNTASHMTASVLVTQALKIILDKDATTGLIRFNVWQNTFDIIKVKKDASCGVCTGAVLKKDTMFEFTVARCKTRAAYSAKPNKQVKLDFAAIKKKYETLLDTPIVVVIKIDGVEIIVHSYGELVFKEFYDEVKVREIAALIYRTGGL